MALNKLSKYVKSSLVAICLASGLVGLESRLYAEIYVPRDYATIQAGIDAVEDGDIVLVAPGEYLIHESISYKGKNVILKSEAVPEKTIIRMENPVNSERASVFVFENESGVVEGFTITGGNDTWIQYPWGGGGIYCKNSSPTIKNNIITRNIGWWGGAILGINSNPIIISNNIFKNLAGEVGGGICCVDNSQPIIQGNIISENYVNNMWGGGIYCGGSDLTPFIVPLHIRVSSVN
jgi:hypothetical protein